MLSMLTLSSSFGPLAGSAQLWMPLQAEWYNLASLSLSMNWSAWQNCLWAAVTEVHWPHRTELNSTQLNCSALNWTQQSWLTSWSMLLSTPSFLSFLLEVGHILSLTHKVFLMFITLSDPQLAITCKHGYFPPQSNLTSIVRDWRCVLTACLYPTQTIL